MPNYYRKDIAAFVANKTSEDSRMTPRRTPKKNVTLSSQYLFEYPGETNRCRKFLYGHYIKNFENEMRVRLRQHEFDESPKLTLANDSVEDQVLAKHTLIRHFATVDGKEGLQVIKTNPPTSNSKTRNLTFVIKQTLSLIYDVGSKFIDDASGVSWDLDSFRMIALAYASVFGEGGGRQTLANHKIILERHDEILSIVLRQQQSFASEQDMAIYMKRADERAEQVQANYDTVMQRLDDYGEILANVVNRLDQHEEQIKQLAKEISQSRLGSQEQLNQNIQQDQSETVVVSDIISSALTQEQLQALFAALDAHESDLVRKPFTYGQDFATLRPGAWLNDTVINEFFGLLKARWQGCHSYSSHFFSKLTEKGGSFDSYRGINYTSVRRWSKKAEAGSIFGMDFLFVPVNKAGFHWALLVVDMKQREIKAYDSNHDSCRKYLHLLLHYLEADHMDKKLCELPPDWKVIDTTPNIPRQENGFDCGVFICMFAYYLSSGQALTFDQSGIDGDGNYATMARAKIGSSILEGKVS